VVWAVCTGLASGMLWVDVLWNQDAKCK